MLPMARMIKPMKIATVTRPQRLNPRPIRTDAREKDKNAVKKMEKKRNAQTCCSVFFSIFLRSKGMDWEVACMHK